MDEDRTSAVQVITEGLWRDDYVPVNAILIVAALDSSTGEEVLCHRFDTDASVWKHIGMLTVVLDDLRKACADSE